MEIESQPRFRVHKWKATGLYKDECDTICGIKFKHEGIPVNHRIPTTFWKHVTCVECLKKCPLIDAEVLAIIQYSNGVTIEDKMPREKAFQLNGHTIDIKLSEITCFRVFHFHEVQAS